MSNIYIQEPPTNGKVVLHTTVGDIEIELWSKECPKACRNFIQLGLEGVYDETIFHRLVKDFIVQGGDPTGTGMGGESIYGEPFKDEFHSRLRFVRRGLVAMANAGKHDNMSQFFFTLTKTPELQDKHTLFGKVIGNTLYNMLKLAESDVDKNEKPLCTHKILTFEVVINPFTDIIPREKKKKAKSEGKNKSKASAVKNFNLLSFGDEAEGDEEEISVANKVLSKPKSAHDILDDEKLSNELAVKNGEIGDKEVEETESDKEEKAAMRERIRDKLTSATNKGGKKRAIYGKDEEDEVDLHEMVETEAHIQQQSKIDAVRCEIKKLKKEMKQEDEVEEMKPEAEVIPEALAAYRAEKEKYKAVSKTVPKKKDSNREKQTLELLERFKNRLSSARTTEVSTSETSGVTVSDTRLAYHSDDDDDEEDIVGDDWLSHQLVAEEIGALKQVKDANVKTEDSYDIHDPRHPINKRRREESKNEAKNKEKSERKRRAKVV